MEAPDLNLGAVVIFKRRIGAAFDINWKASQGNFGGLGVPWSAAAVLLQWRVSASLSKKTGLDLWGGIGWQSTRCYGYQPTSNCAFVAACHTSSNLLPVNMGGGIRSCFFGPAFIRPEARFFHVLNNTQFHLPQRRPRRSFDGMHPWSRVDDRGRCEESVRIAARAQRF